MKRALDGSNPSLKPSDALLRAVLATLQTPQIEDRSRYWYFLASFSEHGDQLSQWRAYAHDASGFSIGFSPEVIRSGELVKQLGNDDLGDTVDLLKVIYRRETQEAIIESLIDVACESINRVIPTLPTEVRKDALSKWNVWFTTSFLRMALLFKHRGFEEEDEWRLILFKTDADQAERVTSNRVQTRASEFGITPYVAVPLCPRDESLQLEHLIAGPKCGGIIAKTRPTFGLNVLCKQLAGGAPSKGIDLSRIPYR